MADLAGNVRFRVKSRLDIIRFATGCLWREAVIHMLKERYAGDLRPLKRSIERSRFLVERD
jgi:hypothetical protein